MERRNETRKTLPFRFSFIHHRRLGEACQAKHSNLHLEFDEDSGAESTVAFRAHRHRLEHFTVNRGNRSEKNDVSRRDSNSSVKVK